MKVTHAELQASINPYATEITGLVTLNETKIKGLLMDWEEGNGLFVNTPKLGNEFVFVPAANVKYCRGPRDEKKLHPFPKKAS